MIQVIFQDENLKHCCNKIIYRENWYSAKKKKQWAVVGCNFPGKKVYNNNQMNEFIPQNIFYYFSVNAAPKN